MDTSALPDHADPAHDFVLEVLHTGLLLCDLVEELLERIPPDAFPGRETGDVLVEMLSGSLRPSVAAAGSDTLVACSALLGALRDRTGRDLEAASERAEARARRAGYEGHRRRRDRR